MIFMKKFVKKYWGINVFCFAFFISCNNQVPKKDLKELQKQNSQVIVTDKWIYSFSSNSKEDRYCGAQFQKKDTTYYFEYRFSKHTKKYYIHDFIKSYTEKGIYYEMELFNNDTLYSFHRNTEDSRAWLFNNKIFSTGKYYYMVKNGIDMNPKKHKFYLQHKDSLIHVKGNNLPPLPESE